MASTRTTSWLAVLILAAAPFAAPGARAADAAGCGDPGWAAPRPAGYVIEECRDFAWVPTGVNLAQGRKILEGRRGVVDFHVAPGAQALTAAQTYAAAVDAARRQGAQLVSDPNDNGYAVLTATTAQGEFWYSYRQTAGNRDGTNAYELITVQVAPLVLEAQGRPMAAALERVPRLPCQDPPWVAKALSGYKIDSCETVGWTLTNVDLAQGRQRLEGARNRVEYAIAGGAKGLAAIAARQNYVTALQGIGASLVSDPNRDDYAVLTQTTPVGEFWYVYRQTAGNVDVTNDYELTTLQIAPMVLEVQARPMAAALDTAAHAPCQDPAWLARPITGYKIDSCDGIGWTRTNVDLAGGRQTIEGARTRVEYMIAPGSMAPAAVAARQNYVAALQAIGAELVSDPDNTDYAVLTQKTPAGEFWYVYRQTAGNFDAANSYELTTLQPGAMPLEVQARAMAAALDPVAHLPCQNPPWLARPLSDFKIDSCQTIGWTLTNVDLAGGRKVIEGVRSRVDYAYSGAARSPAAVTARTNYVSALQAIGAELVSDPASTDYAVLTQTTPAGEFWYVYRQTAGGFDAANGYELTTIQPAPLVQEVQARALTASLDPVPHLPCQAPAWLATPLAGYKIDSCETVGFTRTDVDVTGGRKAIEGIRNRVVYATTGTPAPRSAVAARRNYVAALQGIGAELISDPDNTDYAVLTQKIPAGEFYFVYRQTGGGFDVANSYELTTVQTADSVIEVVARPMAAALDPVMRLPCQDPPWLARNFAYFKPDSCEGRAWAATDVGVAGGTRTVEGIRTRVTYVLTDPRRSPSAITMWKNHTAALQAIGAQLISDPDDLYHVAFAQSTPVGDFVFVYDHGSGNADSTGSYTLTTIQAAPLALVVQTRAMPAPADAKRAGCQEPPWLVKNFPGFRLKGCEAQGSDVLEMDLAGGRTQIPGMKTFAVYELADPRMIPTGLAVTRNFAAALRASGAEVLTAPEDASEVVARQADPAGDYWFVYRQGGGTADGVASFMLSTVPAPVVVQAVRAQALHGSLEPDGKDCSTPPWLAQPLPGYAAAGCTYRDFDSVQFPLPGGQKSVVGHVLVNDYAAAPGAPAQSAQDASRNFVSALQGIGAQLVSDPQNPAYAALTQKSDAGELWYVYQQSAGTADAASAFRLITVQIGGPAPKSCTIEVYGVNFDFDKSVIRPDGEPVLAQVLTLFGDPQFVAEVGGHTDNVGTDQYNMRLSNARANAVRGWLVAHGVAQGRLTAQGYGDHVPLVSNDTDEGRAKNRRVELKRGHCQS